MLRTDDRFVVEPILWIRHRERTEHLEKRDPNKEV